MAQNVSLLKNTEWDNFQHFSPTVNFLVVFHSSITVVKVYADELPRHETQYTKQQNRAFEMAFLQAPIWARKMRVGNSLTFDDAQEKVPIFVNLYWCDIAGSESPPLFTAADKPERPPSKELRRIKSFMQGQKRPPMLSRRAASLMQRSFDDLSLDLGNQKNSPSFCCLCLFL